MKQIIAWFARNGVAANVLVVIILAAGLMAATQIKQEVFPEFSSEMISVAVPYLGAAPEEVEEGICVRVEEAVQNLDGIKKITSTANEGVGAVTIELLPGTDPRKMLDDIKARVDAIDTFPEEAEKPVITEVVLRRRVLSVAVSGAVNERTLKKLGEQIRDELAGVPGITQVELANARPYEISIEVSEQALRRYGMTFDEVARAVRLSSLDLPGGSIRTRGGEILIRSKGQAYRGPEFEEIVLRSRPDGTRLLLRDVANVVDGFAETDQFATFDAERSVLVQVFRVGQQSALEISDKVTQYIESTQTRLPKGISLTIWQNDAEFLKSRLDLLVRNGRVGLVLVFLTLALFLRFRLAAWVTFGILVSFLGTLWVMPILGVSINMISLFAFVLVLGIVVDDAIVVSENVYTHQQRHHDGIRGAVEGTQEVVKPVIFGVLTTVAAFAPLVLVPGNTGKVMKVIPLIVIPTLLFSLIESLAVLPSHLSHIRPHRDQVRRGIPFYWRTFQNAFSELLNRFVLKIYRPFLEKCLEWRYLTFSSALFALLLTAGLVGGGQIKFLFFPPVEGDVVAAFLTMPQGTPAEVTAEAVQKLETIGLQLRTQLDANRENGGTSAFRHMLASVGEQPFLTAQRQGVGNAVSLITGSHLGEVTIELSPSEERTMSSAEVVNRWRELTGPIPDAVELTFTASVFSAGEAVNLQVAGPDVEELQTVAAKIKAKLAEYPGVYDIADSFRSGKKEIKLGIQPAAETLGLSLQNLARQVRQAFYGEEVQRIQRGRDEVKVMVRFPSDERRSLADLEEMRIRTPDGAEVPFSDVARAEFGRGYASIKRVNRHRAINVTAEIDTTESDPSEIVADLQKAFLPQLVAEHPRITYTFEGERREQSETLGGVFSGFILAMLIIYALLAIPFGSYLQPLIVMLAIPFSLVGAVWGHIILGLDLTILSMFGIVALAGVVVNDSLVMVDFINRTLESGTPLAKAIREVGVSRFRAILLTSLTTFAGLTPLLLEKSLQAQFLIPMAVSLGFGVMFATGISLILVPACYLILEDFRGLWRPRSEAIL
ncbi:MAG: efflux RND transporter permease subunit [Verrucomicrobia bacterium]|nr:efflux RND transporter permease subunit [Verrucomicrobiota bacterium]